MSQKVQILGVKHHGSPVFLGFDHAGHPLWTGNAHRIMDWMCDGWRTHFNHHRAFRQSSVMVKDENGEAILDEEGNVTYEMKYLGRDLTDEDKPKSHTQLKTEMPFLKSMPSRVFQSAQREENQDWFAALKRIKTTGSGRTPSFRSRKKDDQIFVCYWVNGENATFRRQGKNTGIVTIRGSQSGFARKKGHPAAWQIKIRVRLTQDIREYTSVKVNWTKKTLVFVNSPLPLERTPSGKAVGIDRGVVHTLATSDGMFLDIPKEDRYTRKKYLSLERKLARQDRINMARGGRNAKFASRRRRATLDNMQRIRKNLSNKRESWIHQTSAMLVKNYDKIVMEDLKVQNMTRRAKLKNVRAKSGLNRSILVNSWGMMGEAISYKANLAGVEFLKVDPAFTSQTCSECGTVDKKSRENQATFSCTSCGHTENADINAAKNILAKA